MVTILTFAFLKKIMSEIITLPESIIMESYFVLSFQLSQIDFRIYVGAFLKQNWL
jgi:hypothetical protein